jgi:hypothetical protein
MTRICLIFATGIVFRLLWRNSLKIEPVSEPSPHSNAKGDFLMKLKWWHFVVIGLVTLTAVDWIRSGQDPITSFREGFTAGYSAASR